MPDPMPTPAPQQTPPLPAGYEDYKPIAATSSAPPLPAGYENYKPIESLPADVAARHARSRTGTEAQVGTPEAPVGETGMRGFATGVGKGEAQTIAGAESLVNKALPNSMQLPKPAVEPTIGTAEKLGGATEAGSEFAAGEGFLNYFAGVAARSPEALALIEKFPRAAALLKNIGQSKAAVAGVKGALVGGTQGAVKGAAKGNAVKEAEEGAVGGGLGGATGEVTAAVIPKALQEVGIGRPYEKAMAKAGRPYVAEHNWKQALEIAKPRIAQFDDKAVKTVDDFVGMLGDEAKSIRQQNFQPYIDKYGSVTMSMRPVADKIHAAVSPDMEELEPAEAKEVHDFASKFEKQMTLGNAEQRLQFVNKQLSKYYKMAPRDAKGLLMTNGTIAKYEAAADGLREAIYGRVSDLTQGKVDLSKAQKEYGAFKDLERVFEKRSTVNERQNQISLYHYLAALTAAGEAMSGHPNAALATAAPLAIAYGAKKLNAPETIARQAIRAARPEGAIESAAKSIASPVPSVAGGAIGAGAGETVADKTSKNQPE